MLLRQSLHVRECRLMLFHDKLPDIVMKQNRTYSKLVTVSDNFQVHLRVRGPW